MARWWAWSKERQIFCGSRHHLPNVFFVDGETTTQRCSHWIERERRECGRWCWIMPFDRGGVLVVDVALGELQTLKSLILPREKIEYFGIFEDYSALVELVGEGGLTK